MTEFWSELLFKLNQIERSGIYLSTEIVNNIALEIMFEKIEK